MNNQNKNITARLTTDHSAGDKVIHTTNGPFKVRKNGRLHVVVDVGERQEYIRVTPIANEQSK